MENEAKGACMFMEQPRAFVSNSKYSFCVPDVNAWTESLSCCTKSVNIVSLCTEFIRSSKTTGISPLHSLA